MKTACFRAAAALLVPVLVVACSSAPDGFGGASRSGSPPGSPNAVLTGDWGGPDAVLSAVAAGATLEFDCAHGSIPQPVQLDAQARFDLPGVYVLEHGGPAATADTGQAARYVGQVNGGLLTLTAIISATGESHGPFVLSLGATPKLVQCY